MIRSLAIALLLGVSAAPLAAAQEETEEYDEEYDAEYYVPAHPLTDLPGSPDGVSTACVFPKADSPDALSLPIGEVVPVVFSLRNEMDVAVNVTSAMGSLNSPFDFGQHLYNFTAKEYGLVVGPQDDVSFLYSFPVLAGVEPVEYTVALTVFFETDDEYFSNTFFNQTVSFHDDRSGVDAQGVYSLLLGILCVAVLFFLLSDRSAAAGGKAGAPQGSPEDDAAWLDKASEHLKSKRS